MQLTVILYDLAGPFQSRDSMILCINTFLQFLTEETQSIQIYRGTLCNTKKSRFLMENYKRDPAFQSEK